MNKITAIFSDVGGVLGTNGWDREGRELAAKQFHLDAVALEQRHGLAADAFETGKLSLDQYLDQIVFNGSRSPQRDEFRDFIFARSQPFADSLALFASLAAARAYFLATLNNESLELNLHRIERFGLRRAFSVFFSSCFLGVKKPDPALYHLALQMTGRAPRECLFIDDRAENVETALACDMQAIRFESAGQLRRELAAAGVAC